jgi:hypothetical protein
VDYDENGKPILPPLTLIFTPDNITHENNPISPWDLGDGGNKGDMNPDLEPERVPQADDVKGVTNTEAGMLLQPVLVPEGDMTSTSAHDETLLHSIPPTSLNSHSDVKNSQSLAPTRPRRNVGTYKQGPAKICKYPIDGQEYDFSLSVISNWENPVPVTANRANVQTKYHPKQRLNKSFLAECYLLQDCWANNPNCICQIYSNIILDSWESDGIYITDILDPRILAACLSVSKYNDDNPSWDTATKGPFQGKFWQVMHLELHTLVNKFKCWDLVPCLPHMNVLSSTWVFKIKQFPDGAV